MVENVISVSLDLEKNVGLIILNRPLLGSYEKLKALWEIGNHSYHVLKQSVSYFPYHLPRVLRYAGTKFVVTV